MAGVSKKDKILTEEQLREIEEAKKHPITFDEDCNMITLYDRKQEAAWDTK